MRRFAAMLLVPAAAMLMVSAVWGKAGTPIQGTPVGLDHDPGGNVAARGKTDAEGNFTASGLAPGRYSVFIFDRWGKGALNPVDVRAGLAGGPIQVSAPILPGRGRIYALDRDGRRLTLTVPGRTGERRGQVNITIVEAATPPR